MAASAYGYLQSVERNGHVRRIPNFRPTVFARGLYAARKIGDNKRGESRNIVHLAGSGSKDCQSSVHPCRSDRHRDQRGDLKQLRWGMGIRNGSFLYT